MMLHLFNPLQTGDDIFFEIEELKKYLLLFRKIWLVECAQWQSVSRRQMNS